MTKIYMIAFQFFRSIFCGFNTQVYESNTKIQHGYIQAISKLTWKHIYLKKWKIFGEFWNLINGGGLIREGGLFGSKGMRKLERRA